MSTNRVFVTGRVAAGPEGPGDPAEFLPPLVREAYAAAGYGGSWRPGLDRWRRQHADRFGPDFKLLPVIEEQAGSGARRFTWRRLVVSMQHVDGLSYQEQYRLLLPELQRLCQEFDAVLPGLADLPADAVHLNGAGAFAIGGPEGDNGLSGKKLVVDGAGPGAPIGGGAFFGKGPHKVDRRGTLEARRRAIAEVRAGATEATVTLVFAPGELDGTVYVEATR